MNEELMPCPNPACGETVCFTWIGNEAGDLEWPHCSGCGMQGPVGRDRDEAVQHWNALARPSAPAIGAVRDDEAVRDLPTEFEAWWASSPRRNRLLIGYSDKKCLAFDAFEAGALSARPLGDGSDLLEGDGRARSGPGSARSAHQATSCLAPSGNDPSREGEG
jgi:hypothetical protein